ncbi:MAG TPA: hypothetical protein VGN69_05840 [Solirubrobacteraceae bacterium]|nr:hypothetical protein [Solirubrobacteraceae bacterium]
MATPLLSAPALADNGTGGAAPAETPAKKPARHHRKARRGHAHRHGQASTAQAPAPSAGGSQATQPPAQQSGQQSVPGGAGTGGSQYGAVNPNQFPTVPGAVGRIVHGLAYAPQGAPVAVQKAIWAANRIIGRPYIYGGGHQAFKASGYDCSGTVSFALHGAHLLSTPMDSSELMGFGQQGPGRWITIYSNPGHAYAVIGGMRLDTSSAGDPSGARGPRWRPLRRSNRGYRLRHPVGL